MADDLPDEFPCRVTTWGYAYDRCRAVGNAVRASEFDPDVVVALARGGWFAGRVLCDFLGMDDLASLKIEHYVGPAATGEEATVRYPVDRDAVEGKEVLVVDDVADTGETMAVATEHVRERDPAAVRTATLQLMPDCDAEPDFYGRELDEWAWLVYPWNFLEDMEDLLPPAMERADAQAFDADDCYRLLAEYHDLDRIQLEVAEPGRMEETLATLADRGVLRETPSGYRPA
jgi:hypoxanthine phosphoribosyltransferase